MNEVIESILNDETYVTNEEKAEALKKNLATVVIPKDKYNDLSNKLKNTETNYSILSSEYEEFKKSKMTDEEKAESERKQFELDKKANAILKSELAVEKLLLKNGIEINDDDTELKETISSIISEDTEKSVKLASNFITLLNKTKEMIKNETTTELLNNTPKPIGGVDSSSSVSRIDELNSQLKKAIEEKNVMLQTRLMSEIFQEQNKQKV